jgi:putative transcriptional regulator
MQLKKEVTTQPLIGKVIRLLRKEIGLTQEQFAAKLGVVFPTVNRWENGHSQPSPLAVKQIEIMLENLDDRGKYISSLYEIET